MIFILFENLTILILFNKNHIITLFAVEFI